MWVMPKAPKHDVYKKGVLIIVWYAHPNAEVLLLAVLSQEAAIRLGHSQFCRALGRLIPCGAPCAVHLKCGIA